MNVAGADLADDGYARMAWWAESPEVSRGGIVLEAEEVTGLAEEIHHKLQLKRAWSSRSDSLAANRAVSAGQERARPSTPGRPPRVPVHAAAAAADSRGKRRSGAPPASVQELLRAVGTRTARPVERRDLHRALPILLTAAARCLRMQKGVMHLLVDGSVRLHAATFDVSHDSVSRAGLDAVARHVVQDGKMVTMANSMAGVVLAVPLDTVDGLRYGCMQLLSAPSRRALGDDDREVAAVIAAAMAATVAAAANSGGGPPPTRMGGAESTGAVARAVWAHALTARAPDARATAELDRVRAHLEERRASWERTEVGLREELAQRMASEGALQAQLGALRAELQQLRAVKAVEPREEEPARQPRETEAAETGPSPAPVRPSAAPRPTVPPPPPSALDDLSTYAQALVDDVGLGSDDDDVF